MVPNEPAEVSVSEEVQSESSGIFDKSTIILREFLSSPTRTTELLASQIMMQIEIAHDMQLYPAKYAMTQEQAGTFLIPDSPPMAKWAMDHMGDIWEISFGHSVLRTGFFVLNKMLKSDTTINVQKSLLQNEKVNKLSSKIIGEKKTKELERGKEIQVSDDAAFWTSLLSTFTLKAIHSMGWISLFHIHDHMDNPVPGMIFGQIVAASVLAADHYAAKNHESIKDLAIRLGKNVLQKGQIIEEIAIDKVAKFGVDTIRDIEDAQLRATVALMYLEKSMDDFMAKIQSWEPNLAFLRKKPPEERILEAKADIQNLHNNGDARDEN